jgi:iron complex outermembrane receptor protein
LYGSRINILNNGVRLAEQEWGVEHAPNVDINNFQHIDVIKGASALKYGGDAIGGVVVMEPEIFPKKDTIKGSVGLFGISNGRGWEWM